MNSSNVLWARSWDGFHKQITQVVHVWERERSFGWEACCCNHNPASSYFANLPSVSQQSLNIKSDSFAAAGNKTIYISSLMCGLRGVSSSAPVTFQSFGSLQLLPFLEPVAVFQHLPLFRLQENVFCISIFLLNLITHRKSCTFGKKLKVQWVSGDT